MDNNQFINIISDELSRDLVVTTNNKRDLLLNETIGGVVINTTNGNKDYVICGASLFNCIINDSVRPDDYYNDGLDGYTIDNSIW